MFAGGEFLEILDEPDFAFDDDGNIINTAADPFTPNGSGGVVVQSDAGARSKVRQEHEEGQMGGIEVSLPTISC